MNIRLYLSGLLAAVMLVAVFASCAGASQTNTAADTEPSDGSPSDEPAGEITETEQELNDAVPEGLNFNGAEFVILANDMYGAQSLSEGLNGEVFNDATYNVELYAEERLNVKISEVLKPNLLAESVKVVQAGDASYDAMSMTDRESRAVAQKGIFFPMYKVPYIDLDQKYWGESLRKDLSFGGRDYFAVSSFNLYSLERTTHLLFNEKVAGNYGIRVPWDDVFGGTWTQEKLAAYGSTATADINGNGEMDSGDSYTYGACDARDITDKFMYASGCKWIDIGDDGYPYVCFYGSEKLVNSLEWTKKVFLSENSLDRDKFSKDFDNINALLELFIDDRELININEFRNINRLRDMESDFSILPLPKYDESQPDYCSYTSNVIFTMVPVTETDLEKAGAVQEVMCCEA
ncbi:MAG: hypothetical protein K6C36_04670, partial [Clostridia bacterium]|nr:hypothetical protein [Clostridia bacterium]